MLKSAYKTLKISPETDKELIRQAYVRLVRRYPPEHFPEKFRQIQDAYQALTLSDDYLAIIYKEFLSCPSELTLAGYLMGDYVELSCEDQDLDHLQTLLTDKIDRLNKNKILQDIDSTTIKFRKFPK
jgi:curved DNA-binding protein CbpA